MLDTLFGDSGYLQYYEDNTNFNYSYSINTTDYPTLHSHVDFCEQAGKHESNRESTRRLKAKKKPWNSLKIPRLWRRRRDSNPREFDLRQDFKKLTAFPISSLTLPNRVGFYPKNRPFLHAFCIFARNLREKCEKTLPPISLIFFIFSSVSSSANFE